MALNNSGQISIGGSTTGQSINLELGRAATASSNLNETTLRTLAGKASGVISLSDFYGKTFIVNNYTTFTRGTDIDWSSSNSSSQSVDMIVASEATAGRVRASGGTTFRWTWSTDNMSTWSYSSSTTSGLVDGCSNRNGASSVFVFVGVGGKQYYATSDISSADPTDNTSTFQTQSGFSTLNANSVAWNGSVFCVVGQSGRVATSTNGTSWTNRGVIGGGSNVFKVISSGSTFYASAGSGYVSKSTDGGATWTNIRTTTNSNINLVYAAKRGSRLCCYTTSTQMSYTDNDSTWNNVSSSIAVRDVIYDSYIDRFVAISGNNLYYSTDGINWTADTAANTAWSTGVTASMNRIYRAPNALYIAGYFSSTSAGGKAKVMRCS